jgi:hypothetical protein
MTLEEKIVKIPGEDGWWKGYEEKNYVEFARILIAKDLTEDEAVEFLSDCYHSVANCYGD